MRRRLSSHQRRAGFTLVETIACITILAALGSITSFLIMNGVRGFTDASVSSQLHAELSIALDRIERELRNVEVASDVPNIDSVTASSIAWNDDYSLTLSGDQVMLAENGAAAKVLLDDVTALSVQTYDESNAALAASLSGAACDPIRRVLVSITMQRSGVSQTLRTKLYVRATMIEE